MTSFIGKMAVSGKLLKGFSAACITAATVIFGFLDYGPRVMKAVDSTNDLRVAGNNCLTDARNFVARGAMRDATNSYQCARDNFEAAAKRDDPKSTYALALIYSDPGVDEILAIETDLLGRMAMDKWCKARHLGFRPAAIDPPFITEFPALRGAKECL